MVSSHHELKRVKLFLIIKIKTKSREGDATAKPQKDGDVVANYLTMTGHICADMNQGAISAILPFLVVGSGYSYLQATMLVFASNIASAVIQPLFGWLGDKFHAPWFMALGVFLSGLGMTGIGYASEYWLVVVSALISGIGVAMFHPEGGRLANLAAGSLKGRGMSIFAVGGNIGFFIGPIICAASLTAFGMHGTIAFLIPNTACAILLLCFNRRFMALGAPEVSHEDDDDNVLVKEHWDLFGMVMGIISARSIIQYGVMAFIPLFLVSNMGQTEAFSSMVISVFAIASAVATAFSGRTAEGVGTLRLTLVSCAFAGIAILAFAFNTNVTVAIVLTIILALMLNIFYPSVVALGMGYVPRHLGMASGLSYGVAICIGGITEPFLGYMGDQVGLSPVMVVLAIIALASMVVAAILRHMQNKKIKNSEM